MARAQAAPTRRPASRSSSSGTPGVDLIAHSGNQNGFISHFYLHRPSRTAYIVSFNTDVSASKTTPSRPTTRQVDAAVRDTIIREVIGATPGAGVRRG